MMETKDDNEIRTYSCPKCYLCGDEGKLLYQSLKDRLFGAPGEWNLKKCTNPECGLVWLDPMPLEEDIGKAYQNYYTHNIEYTKQSVLGIFLRKFYHVVKIIPSHFLGIRQEEIRLNNMYLDDISPGKLLEVGFGNGKFLNQMRLAGWEVEGVDFDSKAVEGVRTRYGFNVHVGSLERIAYPANTFDAITMSHVIEHVSKPVVLLQECYRILKPGGYLVLVTPNINSWGHTIFRYNWRGLEPPRHLHLFAQNTIRKCATEAGFNNINTWTTATNSIGVLNGSLSIQKFGNHEVSREPKLLIFFIALILHYYEVFLTRNQFDDGENLVLLCRKH
ncbi:class I SAM-dependent methyltransferase [Aphanizomenon flos-aquae NRERC-008]|uniref:Class I SAM-dependent methyltransferase n=1 Tax=Aphanizomenon flos-aquae FACHB-1249 TaxID=2692889 RepID=A0ABR8IV74_APHFL|nr:MULTISPECIES: class I SAM-dependent methyltransferase [Aphanizomenon]MBD2391784.1 class I SAM-dependent methyltransferase [Aphanizomenon flos-aquae FACHB-1171]MBD2558314.1 class I SAM-dependent methyltransferase [Aphanizomenon flos-aquae FACHB-1290]MBD2632692.1 class I SAM-dependent methyltransferase [Aphanizomenon sp. FACHB-1399]MBD2643511.1 class I SAM-dependent methyltransferase [Aphanizomenon sp. FACHB-1401]MBD2658454.1 class I SAM-dependent methyltransferase [Aphanizomenon flos-aquae F